jgi:heat shock transcription factor
VSVLPINISLVSDPETDHIVSWNDDGSAFCIKQKMDFQNNVLKKFFKHSNITSFVRQLNIYDFHKVPFVKDNQPDDSILQFAHIV